MKKIFTCILFLSFWASVPAQSHLQWTTPEVTPGSQVNLYKGTNSDKFGNTFTINFTQDPINHYMTYRFFKYNSNGVKQWQYNNYSCFTNCNDIYNIIVPTEDGGAIFVGYYDDLSSAWQLRMKRIGTGGNLVWETDWPGPFASGFPVTALIDHAGSLLVALRAIVTVQTQEDFAVAKFNAANGSPVWDLEIPDGGSGTATLAENINAMVIDSLNNIYCTGRADFQNEFLKITHAGILDYQLVVHDNDSISPFNGAGVVNVCLGNNNDLYLLIGSGLNTWIQKYDASTAVYQNTFVVYHDSAYNVKPVGFFYDENYVYALSNYNYFIPDTTFSGGHYTNYDYMITKLTAGGAVVWKKSFLENIDSLAPEGAYGGAAQMGLCNGHIYVLSSAVVDSAGNYSVSALAKMDTAGIISWVDTTEEHFGPGAFATDSSCNVYISHSRLLGNYTGVVTQKFSDQVLTSIQDMRDINSGFTVFPNPASKEIYIETIVRDKFDLEVINAFGEMILKEKNDNHVDVSSLASGIYFIRVKQGNQLYAQKFVKL